MPDMFSGKGFSEKPLTDDELRQHRERAKHYDERIAPHSKLISLVGIMRLPMFWVISGATASLGYALKSGVLTYAVN